MNILQHAVHTQNFALKLDEVGRLNWTSRIRNLLFTYGFGDAWIAQNIGNPKYFVALFAERLSDCYRKMV